MAPLFSTLNDHQCEAVSGGGQLTTIYMEEYFTFEWVSGSPELLGYSNAGGRLKTSTNGTKNWEPVYTNGGSWEVVNYETKFLYEEKTAVQGKGGVQEVWSTYYFTLDGKELVTDPRQIV